MEERTERQDTGDLKVLAWSYLNIIRCPGGRLVVGGYVCLHCEADPSLGECHGIKKKDTNG